MGTILVIVSIIVVLYLVVFPWMDQNTRQPNYSEEEKKENKKIEYRTKKRQHMGVRCINFLSLVPFWIDEQKK